MELYFKQQLWCPRSSGGSGSSSRSSSPVPHEGSNRAVARRASSPVSVSCRSSRHVTGTALVSSSSSLSSGLAAQHVESLESCDETAAPLHASILGSRIADDLLAKQGTFDGNNYDAPEWEEVSPLISFDAEEHKYVTRCMPREHQRVGDMMGSFDGDDFEAIMRAANDGELSAATTSADEVMFSGAAASIDNKDHNGSNRGSPDTLFQAVCRRRAAAMAAEQQSKRSPKLRHRKAPLGAQSSDAWMLEVPTLIAGQCQQLADGRRDLAQQSLLCKQGDTAAGGLSPRSGGVVAALASHPVQVQHRDSGAALVHQCRHAAADILTANSRSPDVLAAQAGAEGIHGENRPGTTTTTAKQQDPWAAAPLSAALADVAAETSDIPASLQEFATAALQKQQSLVMDRFTAAQVLLKLGVGAVLAASRNSTSCKPFSRPFQAYCAALYECAVDASKWLHHSRQQELLTRLRTLKRDHAKQSTADCAPGVAEQPGSDAAQANVVALPVGQHAGQEEQRTCQPFQQELPEQQQWIMPAEERAVLNDKRHLDINAGEQIDVNVKIEDDMWQGQPASDRHSSGQQGLAKQQYSSTCVSVPVPASQTPAASTSVETARQYMLDDSDQEQPQPQPQRSGGQRSASLQAEQYMFFPQYQPAHQPRARVQHRVPRRMIHSGACLQWSAED